MVSDLKNINFSFICKKTGAKSLNSKTCINKYVATNIKASESGKSRNFHNNYHDMNCENCEQGKQEYENRNNRNKIALKELDALNISQKLEKNKPDKSEPKIKVCDQCKEKYPANGQYFQKDKSGKYGYSDICKQCMKNKIEENILYILLKPGTTIFNENQLNAFLNSNETINPTIEIMKVSVLSRYKLKKIYELQKING